jgi:hypothetical protein
MAEPEAFVALYGAFRPVSCPEFDQSAGVQHARRRAGG